MKNAAATHSHLSTPFVLALRHEHSGKEVLIPKDKQGSPDFFAASIKLGKLTHSAKVPGPIDSKLATMKSDFEYNKGEYFKATREYNKAFDLHEKAKLATTTAKEKKAKPSVIGKLETAEAKAKKRAGEANELRIAYEQGYQKKKVAYEAALKSGKKAPAYDFASSVGAAFGKKSHFESGRLSLVTVAKPVEPVKTKVEPKPNLTTTLVPAKKSSASVTAKAPALAVAPGTKIKSAPKVAPSPTPKPAPLATNTAKPLANPTPLAKSPPLVTGPGSASQPIEYTFSEKKSDQGLILIHTSQGETLSYPLATTQYESKGNNLGTLKLADGRTLWFRHVPAPVVSDPKPPIANSSDTAENQSSPTSAATSMSFTGVPDAEAAEYTTPVPGYPAAKLDIHVWKHKTENKYLVIKPNRERVRMNDKQFESVDKVIHSENYKPSPKKPPQVAKATSTDTTW